MINSIIHHLGIGLQDPKGAEPFFDALLVEYLGMTKEQVWESVAGWKGRGTRIYLYPTNGGTPRSGIQHLAFTARIRQEVEAFPHWAHSKNVEIIDSPQEYPKYARNYFAVFFRGPEGLKLELVHLPESDNAKPL